MALQSHPFKILVEAIDVRRDWQARTFGFFPVTDCPVEDHFFIPLHISVTQKTDQIVGDWSVDGILEINNTWISFIHPHQVTGVKIAMHINLWLCQRTHEQVVKYFC